MPWRSFAIRRLMVTAVLAGIVFRLAFLGHDSFWLDEANSVVIASHGSLSDLWTHADPRHPPLYYVVLRPVVSVAGGSEAAARLPSAVASILSLLLVFVLGRRLRLSADARLLAVSLLALSTIDIWYAREARMYAMATTAGLLMAVGLTIDAWLGVFVAAAGAALAVHLDFTMIPVVALLIGLWWARWWHTGRAPSAVLRLAASLIAAGVALYPLRGQLKEIAALADGATFFRLVKEHTGDFHLTPAIVAIGLCAQIIGTAIVGASLYRLGRRALDPSGKLDRMSAAWIAAAAFTVINAACVLPRAYSTKQVLVTMWPFIALLVAWVISERRRRVIVVAVLSVSFGLSAASLTVHRADWRGVVSYLNDSVPANAQIVLDPSWNEIPYDLYKPRHAALTERAPRMAGDVWLVAERFGRQPPTSPTEAWLDSHGRLMEVRPFARLELRRYRLQ